MQARFHRVLSIPKGLVIFSIVTNVTWKPWHFYLETKQACYKFLNFEQQKIPFLVVTFLSSSTYQITWLCDHPLELQIQLSRLFRTNDHRTAAHEFGSVHVQCPPVMLMSTQLQFFYILRCYLKWVFEKIWQEMLPYVLAPFKFCWYAEFVKCQIVTKTGIHFLVKKVTLLSSEFLVALSISTVVHVQVILC